MKEKSPIEKNAEIKQIDLLSEALNGAPNANGYWMNASGKGYPKFYPHGVSVSPFNGLFMALHSDRNRSEEHTSELQSRFDLVCRLLLEKKKKKKTKIKKGKELWTTHSKLEARHQKY